MKIPKMRKQELIIIPIREKVKTRGKRHNQNRRKKSNADIQ